MNRKQLTPLTLAIAWLLSLGAVFVLGVLSAFALHLRPGSDGDGGGDVSGFDERRMVLLLEELSGRPADLALIKDPTTEQLPEQFVTAIRSLLQEGDPVARIYESRVLIRGLPTRKILGAVRVISDFPPSPMREEFLDLLLEEWGKRDGRSAMLFAAGDRTAGPSEPRIQAVLRGWAYTAPDDAMDWARRTAAAPGVQADRYAEIAWAVAESDIDAALDRINSIQPPALQVTAGEALADFILQTTEPARSVNWILDIEDASVRSEVLAHIAEVWAEYDAPAAAQWVESLPPGLRERAMNAVATIWSKRDPRMAFVWLFEMPDTYMRRQLLEEVAEQWVDREGPLPLAEFINTQPFDPGLDGAVRIVALSTLEADPVNALSWARSISDPTERVGTEAAITAYVARNRPDLLQREPVEPQPAAQPQAPAVAESGAESEGEAYDEVDDESMPGEDDEWDEDAGYSEDEVIPVQ